MTLADAYSNLLKVFGMPNPANAPDFMPSIILNEINATLQMMQAGGEDFFTREALEVALVTGQAAYDLDDDIQSIISPARLSDDELPLRKLTTHGQLVQFGQLFMGRLNNDVPNGRPLAYFLDPGRLVPDGDGGENVMITVNLAPAPDSTLADANVKLLLEVMKEPGAISAEDLEDALDEPPDPELVLPCPHKYVESIFLPIARYNLTHSFLFYDKEKKPQYESDYERALRVLGVADPRRPKPVESRDEALSNPKPQMAAK